MGLLLAKGRSLADKSRPLMMGVVISVRWVVEVIHRWWNCFDGNAYQVSRMMSRGLVELHA